MFCLGSDGLGQCRRTGGMLWCIYLFGAVQLWHVTWALLDTGLKAVGSIFLRVLHCLLFATINLIADGAACQCVQCHSFFTKRGEKKKANWSLVVAEDLTVFYDVCNQPFTAHCSHLWRIFIFLWKRDQGPAVILAFVKPRMSLLTNPFQVLGHHILLTNAA